ncbi:MAG: biotin--[acetyl-CoA-carboxylase] ligase [Proteobacteria bacterium]|nr:biotin--[acetyl-CoA-carboxylase] ligase [Pseudomonadota bacterium]
MNPDPSPVERLTTVAIAAALGELSKRFDVDVLAECDSTNTRLLALAEAGAPAGTVIATERQLAGRGRRGHSWLSATGASLTFSLLWRFSPDRALTGLSLAVGVAVARALEALGIADVQLKWPNDVLLRGGKLAGVLIELVPGARPSAAVIGIGINLAEQGFAGHRQAWLARHAYAGQTVRLLSDYAAPLEGVCRGVDVDGALLLETAAGIQRIISGEVSLRKA